MKIQCHTAVMLYKPYKNCKEETKRENKKKNKNPNDQQRVNFNAFMTSTHTHKI